MPTFNHEAMNGITVNLNVSRQGWNNGVLMTIESPMPISWSDLAGDNAEIAEQNWDGAAVISGELLIENNTSEKILYQMDYDGVYATYLNFPMQFDDELAYGSVAEYSISGVTVTFNFGGVISPITKELSESIYYRQIEDTESWGSEHERKLFIPYQNPVP